MDQRVRAATATDIASMQALEVDAGQRFREIGLPEIAEDPPPTTERLMNHVREGTAWLALDADGEAVGYALASVVDGEAHLDQVSVATHATGHALGRELIDRVHSWARAQGHDTITLTTFRDVAWNGPYYERIGYRALTEEQLGPELTAIRAAERGAGLDIVPRQAMRCRLSG